VTIAHLDFCSYTPPGSPYTDGDENIDGTVVMREVDGAAHPTTFQEVRGHGFYRWDGAEFDGGEGVVYVPSRAGGEVPANGDDRSDNAAHTSWAWDDHNDDLATGALALDPALLVTAYFGGTGEFARAYTDNRFGGVGVAAGSLG
jgi:hypothetical protein